MGLMSKIVPMQMLIYSKILENGLSITFKTYGYCYLKNHGIDENLLNEYSRVSKSFFEQPESFDFLRHERVINKDYFTSLAIITSALINEKTPFCQCTTFAKCVHYWREKEISLSPQQYHFFL